MALAADSPCGSQYIISMAPLLQTSRIFDPATQHFSSHSIFLLHSIAGSGQTMVLEDRKQMIANLLDTYRH
jgi:hypothetical protein